MGHMEDFMDMMDMVDMVDMMDMAEKISTKKIFNKKNSPHLKCFTPDKNVCEPIGIRTLKNKGPIGPCNSNHL
jgi:hypothetical protein